MQIDGVIELDDEEFEGHRPELVDVQTLWVRTGSSGPDAIESMIDLCVAAAELCGDDYRNPQMDCDRAYRDLQRVYWQILNQDGIERGNFIFSERFRAAIARWDLSIAADEEGETDMVTATSGKLSKRTREKSAQWNARMPTKLRIELRLKFSGFLTFAERSGYWSTKFCVSDKTGERFDLDYIDQPEEGFASELEAVQQSFQALREWCEELIEKQPKERSRLLEVIEQLTNHEFMITPGLASQAIPESQAEAAAKEAAADGNHRPFPLIAIEQLIASRSVMELMQNKIRKPVSVEGRLWVATGGCSSGRDGYISIEYYEVVPASDWQGETVTYADICDDADRRRESPEGFYHGQAVTCGTGKKQVHYVLKGPKYTTSGHGFGKIKETSDQPPAANDWTCSCDQTHSWLIDKCQDCGDQRSIDEFMTGLAAAHQVGEKEKPKKSKGKAKASKPAAGSSSQARHIETRDVPLVQLFPHPLNPRSAANDPEIEDLAKSMESQGQLVEAIGRIDPAFPSGVQLLAGHRRFEAAKRLGWTTLRVRIIDANDQQALEILGRDNEDRKDFSPLERARWYQSMLETLGCSQRDLAKRLSISQGQIANTLAVLGHGDAWHELLRAGKVQPSHLRVLTQFHSRPALLDQLAEKYTGYLIEQPPEEITTRDFERFVYEAVKQIGRTLKDQFGNAKVKVTDKNRDELDIIEIPRSWGGTEQVVMNTQVFDTAVKEAKKKEKEKAKKEKLKQQASGSGKPAVTGYESHKVDQAKQNWICNRLADAIEKLPKKERSLPLKLFMSMAGTEVMYEVTTDRKLVSAALQIPLEESDRNFLNISDFWGLLAELDVPALEQAIRRLCASAFRERGENHYYELFEDSATFAGICDLIGVDLHRDYVPTAEVLDLYPLSMLKETSTAQRMEASDEAGFAELSASKETLILALISEWTPGELPPGME